ncbi:MAG TPA: biosynthetic-type acetolactate synthase large subunit [Candidatus Limnocylindria bacterium]|nr:biosynthetic-type acetolactate synthase large subunit [Candidatus Limnocylindria bacterium]
MAIAAERAAATVRGADAVCDALERAGADVVFGYPGGACLPIYDALPDHPALRHVLVRHEQGAAHMADGYARVRRAPGVCLVTSGPGATNLVTGLASAYMDSVPVVAITGQVSTALMGRDAFQETDVLGMVAPITKHAFLVERPEDIAPQIARAFRLAVSGRPGPVVVDVPKDVQNMDVPVEPRAWRVAPHLAAAFPAAEVDRAAALLADAERPLIVAGHGVRLAGGHGALRRLAERLDAPVAHTLLGLGALPESHPLSVGMIGMHGVAALNRAANEADVILGVGLRWDDRVTGKLSAFARNARVVHVDIDASQIGKNVPTEVGIVADARAALEALVDAVPRRRHPAWRAAFARRERPRLDASDARVEIAPRAAIRAIRAAARPDAYFVADVGQHQMWAAQHLGLDAPDRYLTSGGLGAMGYAFPAAIGAQLADPDADVWAIAGDGGAQMTVHELGTAVQERLPVKLVILNNGYLGMVRQWQQLFFGGRISQTPITSPDYAKLAAAYGALGITVERRADLAPALERAARAGGPAIVDVRIEQAANVWPIVPPGGANAETMEEPAR